MEKNIIKLCALLFAIGTQAQNLVKNGSFEESCCCPQRYNQLKCSTGWASANDPGTPDYFNVCCKDTVSCSIPKNWSGYQFPRSGEAYAGFYLLSSDYFVSREYIQSKLAKRLQTGRSYRLSFYMSLGDRSEAAFGRIGVCFSETDILYKERFDFLLSCKGGCREAEIPDYKDSTKWNRVEMLYKAKGGENYITIGLFKNHVSVSEYKKLYFKENEGTCYYYIDDVELLEVK